jgi:hypothetical protein
MHVVLDASAMVAAGRTNQVASRLIDWARKDKGWRVYAPTCALVEADRTRRGTAEHFAMLPAVTMLPLDLPGALAVMTEDSWGTAHVRYEAKPSFERPHGAYIATAEPEQWKGQDVRIIDINPPEQ